MRLPVGAAPALGGRANTFPLPHCLHGSAAQKLQAPPGACRPPNPHDPQPPRLAAGPLRLPPPRISLGLQLVGSAGPSQVRPKARIGAALVRLHQPAHIPCHSCGTDQLHAPPCFPPPAAALSRTCMPRHTPTPTMRQQQRTAAAAVQGRAAPCRCCSACPQRRRVSRDQPTRIDLAELLMTPWLAEIFLAPGACTHCRVPRPPGTRRPAPARLLGARWPLLRALPPR